MLIDAEHTTKSKSSVLERMKKQQPISQNGLSKDITLGDFAIYWLNHLKTDLKESTRYA